MQRWLLPSWRQFFPKQDEGAREYGGNLFDFLCYWHEVDAKTLWHRILTGEVF
jgi:hypothetical protein